MMEEGKGRRRRRRRGDGVFDMQMRKEWPTATARATTFSDTARILNRHQARLPNITVNCRSDLLGLFLKITFHQHQPTTFTDRDYRVNHVFEGPVNIFNCLRFIFDIA